MVNQLLRPAMEVLPENNRLERIWILAKVDFQKRYYNNRLGLFWALLNPLFQLGVYYFVFTSLFTVKIEYFALYMFIGLLFWMFFSESTTKGIYTLLQYQYLIENIQLNKVDLFLSSTLSVFIGFLFNISAFFFIAYLSGVPFHPTVFFFPLFVLNMYLLALACSMLLATINIYLKDVHHLWDMVTLLGIWLAPVFYSEEIFREKLGMLLYANPFAGIIINVHNTVLYGKEPDYSLLIYTLGFSLVLLAVCYFLFLKFAHKAIEKL